MNNALFCSSFAFREFLFTRYHHTDARSGSSVHYLGRMRSGSARLISDREQIEVREGDLFYIPLGCRYQSYWYGEKIRFDSLAFRYFPQDGETRYPLQRIEDVPPEAASLLESLGGGLRADCASVGRLFCLLALLLPRMTPEAASPEQRLVQRALAYMSDHGDFRVPELAAHCRVSESALYAAFRTQTGSTPVHTRQRMQIERAVQLLHTTDLPVEQISAQLGFSSPAYFRRVLRRVEGKTPREIRRESAF